MNEFVALLFRNEHSIDSNKEDPLKLHSIDSNKEDPLKLQMS